MADATYLMGNSSLSLGKIEDAATYYSEAKDLFKEGNKEEGQYRSTYGLANIQRQQGDYVNALENFQNVLEFYEREGAIRNVIVILQTIASLHKNTGNYDQAIEYNTKVLSLADEHNNKSGKPYAYSGLGTIYALQEDYKKAIEYFQLGVDAAVDAGTKPAEIIGLANLASAYVDDGQLEKGEVAANRALDLSSEIKYAVGLSSASLIKAKIAKEKGNYNTAIALGEKALSDFRELDELSNISESAGLLYESYKAKGNSRKALQMYELFKETCLLYTSPSPRD